MVGQQELINSIKSNELPKSMLLVGDKGCGKHTLVREISDYFGLKYIDMTDVISVESIAEAQTKATPTMYLINIEELTEKQQNMVLKFVEEPSLSSYVVLISTSKNIVLPTLLNRCVLFEFSKYTREELLEFIPEGSNVDLILKVCSTPGMLKCNTAMSIESMYDLCNKIITRIDGANFANTLTICNKINFKDEYDKFDFYTFMGMLVLAAYENYVANNNPIYLKMYNIIREYKIKLMDSRLNKEYFTENLLIKLWKAARGI